MAGVGAAQTDASFESAAQQTSSNNSTVQHERPDEASESGDSQQVSQWLERRLATQLEDSAVSISQGEYDQAKDVLGDDYSSRLNQYVSVAGETDTESDDSAAESYQEAQQNQSEYANATQEYRETYDRYQQARADGNTTAARQAARELERQSTRVQQLNSTLQREYETLTNQTGVDTGQARTTLRNTTTNVTAQQATVRAQTFVETNLTVRTNESAVAFDDPSMISGQIRLANGTALRNVSGRLIVADRSYRISTDSDGRFSVSYRPVLLPVNATSAPVQFLPANDSAYLGSTGTVPVNVTQVTPRLQATTEPTRGDYGDRLGTTVVATVDGRPVPSLPLRARLGGAGELGRTDGSGRVTLSPQVPVGLLTGDQSLRVLQPRTDTAVGPNATTTAVTITETATELTLTTSTEGELRIQGRLKAVDGVGIGGETIQLSIGGTNRSVETNATGWYRTTVSNVSTGADNGDITIIARFDGSGTNLRESRAETSVTIGTRGGEGDSTMPLVLGGVIFGVLVVGGVVGWSRWQGSAETGDATLTDPAETPQSTTTPDQSSQWLDRARSALAAGDDERAVVAAYGAVRRHLEREATLASTLTHREFIDAAAASLSDSDIDALSTVATGYERTTFRGVTDGTTAEETIEAAAEIVPEPEASTG